MPIVEYAPTEMKRAVVGFGRAEKHQVEQMVKLLLGLDAVPAPHDVADALAVAICHIHSATADRWPRPSPRDAARRRATPQLEATYRRVIARLNGTLVEKSPNRLVVDVGGVGYDVLVPLSTFYSLGDAGSGVTLRVHTHVREDVIALYGFGTASGTGSVRAADRGQRYRAEAGAGGAVGHRRRRAGARHPHPGRRAPDEDSRASERRPPSGSAWS